MNKSKVSIKLIAPVLFSFFVMSFSDLVGIGVDRAKTEFDLSNTQAQLIPFVVFLWFFVLSVPIGIFQDRIGNRKMLTIGMVVTVLGLLFPFLFNTYHMILVGFAFIGIGNTVLQVSANPLLVDVVPSNKRSSFLSFSQFIKSIGSMATAPLVVWFAFQFGNWKVSFLLFALLALVNIIWLMSINIQESSNTEKKATFKSSFRLLGNPYIAMMVACIFAIVGLDVGINATSGQYLLDRFSTEATMAESVRSLYFFGKMLGTFTGTLILTKLSSKRCFLVTSILGMLVLVCLIFSTNDWMALVVIFLIGISLANIFPLVFSLAVEKFPDRKNEISGLMIMAVVGGAVLPPIMGWLSDMFSVTASLLVLLMAMGGITIVSLINFRSINQN
ncbi:MFS transporter [Chondrinema litorale]|uniref:MFS transporter n=1 Tax=Chondrinema litorale TaxID=2994555 RepID=UPI0025431280|nr:MFS transporter [Chondrinema litorale]UZR99098.1 MFS transporter [Chondrinema litorale]